MKEEEVQKIMIEMALKDEEVMETWVKSEKRKRCRMRAEEGHRRLLKTIASRIRTY